MFKNIRKNKNFDLKSIKTEKDLFQVQKIGMKTIWNNLQVCFIYTYNSFCMYFVYIIIHKTENDFPKIHKLEGVEFSN